MSWQHDTFGESRSPVEYVKIHIDSHLKHCIPCTVRIGSSLALHFTVSSNILLKICILWAIILIRVGSWILVAIHLLYLDWVIAFLILEYIVQSFFLKTFLTIRLRFKIQFGLIQILNNAEMWCAASSVTRLLNLMFGGAAHLRLTLVSAFVGI